MTYLLDTAFLSELPKRQPSPGVVAWLGTVREDEMFTSVFVVGELQRGIARLADPARARFFDEWLTHAVRERFGDRTLPFDERAAMAWGGMVGRAELQGVTLPPIDSLIAATALVHGLTVVTRNTRDFERCGVPVVNPWDE